MRCNLRVQMAKRKVNITKVSKDTGISRTTLTALYHEKAVGIQFKTMNILCNYLHCKPNDLFVVETPVELAKRLAEEDFLKRQLTLDDVLKGEKS